MTPSQLLELIEESGLVDRQVLAKLQAKVADAKDEIKPKHIINHLIKHKELTAEQGEMFLSGKFRKPGAGNRDQEFQVKAGRYERQDTDDLMNLRPTAPNANATQIVEVEYVEGGTEIYDAEDAVEEVAVPVSVQATNLYDPFAPASGGFATQASPTSGNEPDSSLTFTGKKDNRDQWKTPWLVYGTVTLGVLLCLGTLLVLYVFSVEPEGLFNWAEKAYTEGNYMASRNIFVEFHKKFPGNSKVSHAKVRAVQCLVQQAVSTKNFSEAHKILVDEYPNIENEAEIGLVSEDMGVWAPEIVLDFSEKAVQKKTVDEMKAALAKAEDAKQILDFLTGAQRKEERIQGILNKIDNNLKITQGLINKETDYSQALVDINQLIPDNKTDEAFRIFGNLTRKYGDLGARVELRDLMKKVTEREVNLIVPSSIRAEVSTADSATTYDHHISMVSKRGTPTLSIQDELIPIQIEGCLYMISGKDGEILWSRFLGYESMKVPQWINESSKDELLAFDERSQELLRLDARTGALRWRSRIGEAFVTPTVHNGSIYLATRSGSVIRLNIETGEQVAATKLPKQLSVPLAVAEQDPFIYAVGDDSNIYVLSSEDLTCSEVFYFGHNANQVRTAPIYWTGHLIVVLNGEGAELHVLRVANKGLGLERLQIARIADGMISLEPTRLGRNMLFVADNGDLTLIEMTISEEKNPVAIARRERYDTRGASHAYVLAQGSGMWIGSKGLSVFELNKVKGEVKQGTIVQANDIFLAPMLRFDDVLVMTYRRQRSRQISVAAVNAKDLSLLWRSDFGAPAAESPIVANEKIYSVSSQGDVFDLTGAAGGACLTQTAKASDIDDPMNFTTLVNAGGNLYAGLSSGDSNLVSLDLDKMECRLTTLREPSSGGGRQAELVPATEPVGLSKDFLVAALSGLILRVDGNGRAVGAPFQPPLAPGESLKWQRPSANRQDRVLVGDDKQNVFLLDAAQAGSLTQVSQLVSDGQIQTPFVGTDDFAFAITVGDGKILLQKFPYSEPLQVSEKVELAGRPISGPFVVGDQVLAHLDDGKLYAWSLSCQPLWSAEIPNDRIASIFAKPGTDQLIVAFENGKIMHASATGQLQAAVDLGRPIRHRPIVVGSEVYFSTANGEIIVLGSDRL